MKVYRFTKTGQYHQMLGKENQDYICSLENGKILAIMLADGATGCRKGMEGAKLACEAVSRVIETEGNTFFKYPEKKAAYLLTEQILYWIEQHKGKEDLTEYGSTFLLVLMEKKTGESVLVNLGDGAAISEKDHRLLYLMEPRRIIGDTCLTTTIGAEQVMEIETKRIALGECVILGSDGFLEMTTDEQIYEALKERNLEQLNQHISVIEQSIRFMDKKMEEYKEAEMNYTLLKDLSDTANGEQKGKTKISFERFVQSVYFDLILAAANERLSVMSEQRYYLLRKEENDINKGSSGLELEMRVYVTEIAANCADKMGRSTLETTLSSKGIELPNWDVSNPSTISAWNSAYSSYAMHSSGNVEALLGNTVRPTSVWNVFERTILRINSNVGNITIYTPTAVNVITHTTQVGSLIRSLFIGTSQTGILLNDWNKK